MNRSPMLKNRRGMTGLETAIILVAFVITAAAFAFVVLNMGFLTAQKSQTVISAGMQEASSSLLADGDIIARFNTSTKNMTEVIFYVRLSQGHEPIDASSDKMIITYSNPRGHTVIYDDDETDATSLDVVVGDADGLIEVGERWKVNIAFTNVTASDFSGTLQQWSTEYDIFRIELRPSLGAVLTIERTIPAINEAVMVLE